MNKPSFFNYSFNTVAGGAMSKYNYLDLDPNLERHRLIWL